MIGDWTLKSVALPFEVSNTSALLFLLSHKEIWQREVDRCNRTGPLGVLQSRLNFRILFSSFFPVNNLLSLVSFVYVFMGVGAATRAWANYHGLVLLKEWLSRVWELSTSDSSSVSGWTWRVPFPVYARILSALLSHGEPQPLWVYEWNSCVMPRW